VEVAGLRVKVEEICDHRIEKALVSKLNPDSAAKAEAAQEGSETAPAQD
jgi:hypothetical protein